MPAVGYGTSKIVTAVWIACSRWQAAQTCWKLALALSFRGLELTRTSPIHYVDTDLPALSALKAELVARLHPEPLAGTLCVQALDALDAQAFQRTVAAIPDGPLAIANEGLLVYLNEREKVRLAANVRAALEERGGRWLTADVYLKNPGGSAPTVGYGASRAFIDAHRIEQNKFPDWPRRSDSSSKRASKSWTSSPTSTRCTCVSRGRSPFAVSFWRRSLGQIF